MGELAIKTHLREMGFSIEEIQNLPPSCLGDVNIAVEKLLSHVGSKRQREEDEINNPNVPEPQKIIKIEPNLMIMRAPVVDNHVKLIFLNNTYHLQKRNLYQKEFDYKDI